MAESVFVNQLVSDYVENGFADSPEHGVLTRPDGEGHVELARGANGESLDVFIGGDFVDTVNYDSDTFAEDLNGLIHEELGF